MKEHILGGPKNTGKVYGVKATGNMVLVEILTPQDATETIFTITENTTMAPQGYIVDIGPMIKQDEWGFKVGDRVVIQGKYVPIPSYKYRGSNQRELGIVQTYDIKCVLQED